MLCSSRFAKLQSYVVRQDAPALCRLLLRMSNADFRQASALMRSADFWQNVEESIFWSFAAVFVEANSKAFLGAFLRAMEQRHSLQRLNFQGETFDSFVCACTTPLDRKKAAEAIFPLIEQPAELARLIRQLDCHDGNHLRLLQLLFHVPTDAARFLFFQEIKQHDDDTAALQRFAIDFLRLGDHRSFNMSRIMQCYFALPPLPGTFSLEIPDYELSRLDDFSAFLKILAR